MDFSFRYTARRPLPPQLPVADYIARFRDAKRFLAVLPRLSAITAAAGDARRSDYDVGRIPLRQYTSALIIATKIAPAETARHSDVGSRPADPPRAAVARTRGCSKWNGRYGGRSFAYVGTCLHCPEGTCTRPEAETLPPPRHWSGPSLEACGFDIAHTTSELVRHRTEMGYRRIIARVFDPCLRVLP